MGVGKYSLPLAILTLLTKIGSIKMAADMVMASIQNLEMMMMVMTPMVIAVNLVMVQTALGIPKVII